MVPINLSAQLSKLEYERDTLRRELDAIQDDYANRQTDEQLTENNLTIAERFRDMTELVRQKNQHITQLLNDIEISENENKILKKSLTTTRDELQNATVYINTISAEYRNLKCLQDEYTDRIKTLELNDSGLRNQIAELVAEKEKCEEQIDELSDQLESRIKLLSELLSKKDDEIATYKSQLGPLGYSDSQNEYLAKLQETVARQEDHLNELKKQLHKATNDLNRSASALEQQKKLYNELLNKSNESPEIKDLQKNLSTLQEQLEIITDKAKVAEEDATNKAEQISKLIIQVREFESGVFGLEEAMEENRKIKKELETRDKEIEELISTTNRLYQEADLLEQDNLAMKEKLGLSIEDIVRSDGMIARYKDAQTRINFLQNELDECKEIIVNLKLKNRNLLKSPESTRNISPNGKEELTQIEIYKPDIEIVSDLEDNVRELIDENESLRKGLHEVLDSLHNQDGSSTVRIECQSLERLLQAMDARHVAGWYQPGMRLLAQINHLDGVNANLRYQLHSLHDALTEAKKELYNSQISTPSLKITENINENDLEEENYSKKKEQERSFQLEQEVKMFQHKFEKLQQEMGCLNNEYDNERLKMTSTVEKLEIELNSAHQNEISLKERLSDFENSWKSLIDNPNEIKSQLSYNVIRVAALTEELQITKRMYDCCLDSEKKIKIEKQKGYEELCTIKKNYSEEIERLLKYTEQQNVELNKFKNQTEKSININEYQIIKKELEELTIKHREILHTNLFKEDTYKLLTERLIAEVMLLKDQRQSSVIEIDNINGDDIEITALKSEKMSLLQRAEHAEKMYALLKEQMEEMEVRCKNLEQNLCNMMEANLKSQTEEVRLRETTVNMIEESEYAEMAQKLKTSDNNLDQALQEKTRLLKILDITQSQVRDLEHHHKLLDQQHAITQRRIIELQALSDERSTIDRLMREISTLEEKQIAAEVEDAKLKSTIQDQQTTIANLECKNDEIIEQYNSNNDHFKTKIMRLENILLELQNRYSGAISLVNEHIWVTHKQKLEEAIINTYRKWLDNTETSVSDDIVYVPTKTNEDYRIKFTQLQLKELNTQMACDDLRKKLQLCTERIEKQDYFIDSLEKEIVRLDSEFMHNYMSWGIKHFRIDTKNNVRKIDKQISVQSITSLEQPEDKDEYLEKKIKYKSNTIEKEKKNQDEEIKRLQVSLNDLETYKNQLQKDLIVKDDEIRKLNIKLATSENVENDLQNPALLTTIESLEIIVNQKEETISRLQELLKECREDHVKEITELQKKIENSELINRVPQKDVSSPIRSNNIQPIVNQYILRIADLEDKLKQSEDDLAKVNSEKEHWSGVAERRLKEMEQNKTEDDSEEKDLEITRLNEIITGLRAKRDSLPAQRDRLRMEVDKLKKKIDEYERREKEDKAEIQKLRQQIIYRPPANGKREDTICIVKEEVLTKKIKALETELEEYKKKDEENKVFRKMKSDEQVSKWEVNKRHQTTIEKLQTRLVETTREGEALRLNNQRLRDNLTRMEKDRNVLELKLKSANAAVQSNALAKTLIEELTLEKDRLINEVHTLRSAKEMTSGGTSLAEVVVELRRKITTLELLQKGGNAALIKEIDTLKDRKNRIEKTKLALEEENVRLKKKIDQFQLADNGSGITSLSSDSMLSDERKQSEKPEKLIKTKKSTFKQIKGESKLTDRINKNIDDKDYVEKLQNELQTTQSYYLDSSEKCSQLEQQLQDYRSQYQSVLEENENLKCQLEKKCHLLGKTKTMLERAAAREQLIIKPDRQRPDRTHFIA
ncbi:centrosomal protein of 290 kDa isoform X2 [Daktulosphaira vitifoliae]|uniref:centrosomal protein of 290 kDa isoform X2 n=1 Tax=Daktulosphaira vitifoliae TaxID=58002 RepID=UPI0021A9893E|nr:centrosomal protein of 290 kDa isoform X2 [Daktulosphaira vitifoliae]